MHYRAAAVAAADRHQTLGLKDPQRLPQGHQADVELLDEHFLARQQVAVGQFAFDDLPAQFVGDDFGGPARREPAADFQANSVRSHCLSNTNSAVGYPIKTN